MKVVILAAGTGKRLGKGLPKCLVPLANGRTILEHQLDCITQYISPEGITVVVGYKASVVTDAFPGVNYVVNEHYFSTNTAYSLWLGLNSIDEDDVLWINGDVVFEGAILEKILTCKGNGVVVNRSVVGAEEVKYILGNDGYIAQISKSVDVEEALGEALGINLLRANDINVFRSCLGKCLQQDYFEEGMQKAIVEGVKFLPIDIGSFFCKEIDYPEDLEAVNNAIIGIVRG